MSIHLDVPDPHCAEIRPEQGLQVENRRTEVLRVRLAQFEIELVPDESDGFERPLGELLPPGVHQISVELCCDFELWLREE